MGSKEKRRGGGFVLIKLKYSINNTLGNISLITLFCLSLVYKIVALNRTGQRVFIFPPPFAYVAVPSHNELDSLKKTLLCVI